MKTPVSEGAGKCLILGRQVLPSNVWWYFQQEDEYDLHSFISLSMTHRIDRRHWQICFDEEVEKLILSKRVSSSQISEAGTFVPHLFGFWLTPTTANCLLSKNIFSFWTKDKVLILREHRVRLVHLNRDSMVSNISEYQIGMIRVARMKRVPAVAEGTTRLPWLVIGIKWHLYILYVSRDIASKSSIPCVSHTCLLPPIEISRNVRPRLVPVWRLNDLHIFYHAEMRWS